MIKELRYDCRLFGRSGLPRVWFMCIKSRPNGWDLRVQKIRFIVRKTVSYL